MTRAKIAEELAGWLLGKATMITRDQSQPPAQCVLNVAGSRESKCQGIEQIAFKVMVDVLIRVNPDCRAVYPPV